MVKKKSGVSEVEMVKDLKVIVEEKMGRKKAERDAYLVAAIVSSFGITSMAAIAVYYRFSWQLKVFFPSPFSFTNFLYSSLPVNDEK